MWIFLVVAGGGVAEGCCGFFVERVRDGAGEGVDIVAGWVPCVPWVGRSSGVGGMCGRLVSMSGLAALTGWWVSFSLEDGWKGLLDSAGAATSI